MLGLDQRGDTECPVDVRSLHRGRILWWLSFVILLLRRHRAVIQAFGMFDVLSRFSLNIQSALSNDCIYCPTDSDVCLVSFRSSETHVEDEEGLYDCVYGEDEGGEVYEDLMKAEEAHPPVGL